MTFNDTKRRSDRGSSTRIGLLWSGARDSLWFVPALSTAIAFALAVVIVRVDSAWNASGTLDRILFSGGADGARGVLTAVAGSLITVTGVVFSVTVVALQLASSQFTPRVLRGFMADPANQIVLGIFIGTFTYTVMILRTVTGAGDNRAAFVPELGVTVAILLVLVSIGALIYFINHAARSVQAAVILTRETQHALKRMDHLFPRDFGEPDAALPVPRAPTVPAAMVLAADSGYLLAVHADSLFDLAEDRRLTIRMDVPVGGFVIAGEAIASVWPASAADRAAIEAVRDAFVLGEERTPDQDVDLGIIVISDIAVRALSPGVNDPTTAMLCIDRLSELLVRLGTSREPLAARTSSSGDLRFLARMSSFEHAVGLAFDQIRHYGAGNPTIAMKLFDSLRRIAELVPAGRRGSLAAQAEMLHEHASTASMSTGDRQSVEHVAAACFAALVGDDGSQGVERNAAHSAPRATLSHR
ncbi:MAG TPA: DUF2254 domain-containing protein [Gemmatimonadaceae bacterium]|nr:DUF2254 domain-containing protein [Gemmatimonadaceae bacterium]